MDLTRFSFNRTGNSFLNIGILGLYTYLKKAKKENRFEFPFEFTLEENQLLIGSENLPDLLEELYYWMGSEVYDTFTQKQQDDADRLKDCNVYYDRDIDKFVAFPRMNTYGLTHLLTNNAQGVTRNEEGWTNFVKLEISNPAHLIKFNDFFERSGLKKLSKLYYEPYTKISRLPKFKESYWQSGKNQCYLTGESYKELVDITNTSAFFSGIQNFNSNLSGGDKKISWKTRYISMFSPVHAYYHYPNKLRETIYIYLLSSNSLVNLRELLTKIDVSGSKVEIKKGDYVSNIKFSEGIAKDIYTEQFEVALALTYSIYNKIIAKYGNLSENQSPDDDLFADLASEIPPISIESFKADKFASTMRPNAHVHINRLTAIFRLFYELEKSGIVFGSLMRSLKLIKPSERNAQNKFRLERMIRNQVASEILENKSILHTMEDFLFRCYSYQCSIENIGFKNFKQLFLFTELYELKINTMEESLQIAAITLGKQIGIKMRNQSDSQPPAANAKRGRGDLIKLRKARTKKQFLDELTRIDFKYGLSINEELATKITEQNYYTIKQFLIIGALNILNPAIHPFNKTEKTTKS